MPQITEADSLSLRVFLVLAGDELKQLDDYELADVMTVLLQARTNAAIVGSVKISTDGLSHFFNLVTTDRSQKCIDALEGFSLSSVDGLLLKLIGLMNEVRA